MRSADRFTQKANLAITRAQRAAAELGHSYVGSEHLLLGLAAETEGLAARFLRERDLDEAHIRALTIATAGRGASGPPWEGLTPRAHQVIEAAAGEAAALGHPSVGTEPCSRAAAAPGASAPLPRKSPPGGGIPGLWTSTAGTSPNWPFWAALTR